MANNDGDKLYKNGYRAVKASIDGNCRYSLERVNGEVEGSKTLVTLLRSPSSANLVQSDRSTNYLTKAIMHGRNQYHSVILINLTALKDIEPKGFEKNSEEIKRHEEENAAEINQVLKSAGDFDCLIATGPIEGKLMTQLYCQDMEKIERTKASLYAFEAKSGFGALPDSRSTKSSNLVSVKKDEESGSLIAVDSDAK